MRIGDVARECGLQASAIRYYEQAGLLPKARRVSGCRVYDGSVLHQIAFIQFAREAGFTIEETRSLTDALRPDQPLSARLRRLAVRKIEEVDQTISRARLMKDLLTDALQCNCIDVEECGGKIRAARKNEVGLGRQRPRTGVPAKPRRFS